MKELWSGAIGTVIVNSYQRYKRTALHLLLLDPTIRVCGGTLDTLDCLKLKQ